MNFAYSARVKVGILIIVSFALVSNYQLFTQWVQSDLSFVGHDEITLNEKRFEEIKERLPSHGVVGYRPNNVPTTLEQLMFGNPSDLQNWFLTQYALAPVIVSPTLGHTLIVSTYRNNPGIEPPRRTLTIRETEDGKKVLDFGNGVMLIKRDLE